MVKTNGSTWSLVVALAFVSLPAFAADSLPGQQGTVKAQKVRLESAYKTLASNNSTRKLGTARQAEVMQQRTAIKDMIKRLEQGDQVAPREIDRVIQAR